MSMFLLGLLALLLALTLMRSFARANPATMARYLRQGGGLAALLVALLLLLRGQVTYALPLVMAATWLFSGAGSAGWGRWLPGGVTAGKTTRVNTAHLEMELDHDTGNMRGRVIKGVFAGRSIESMAPAELALMWQDCRFSDPQSAQLLEAYLDRRHPSWRDDMSRAEATPGAGGIMTREEAYSVLGLRPGATKDEIRAAHRELMMRMHPDRGGSTYLATKINQAKDVLLA